MGFLVVGFFSLANVVRANSLDEEGCLPNHNYSSTTGQRCGCSHNEIYSSATGLICARDSQVIGYLSEQGPSITMWGTHIITNDGFAVCVTAPCPSAESSYLVSAGGSSSVLSDLQRYENSKVKIIGRLQWYDLEGGFWGFVARDVIPINTVKETIKVISPNGGETIRIGQKYNIKWESYNLSGPKVNVFLEDDSINCPSGIVGCWSSYAIAGLIQNDGSYLWDTSLNLFGSGGPNTYTIRPGVNYRIKVCSSMTDVCDESDNYFSFVSSQINTPVISGISGPQRLNVNQTGTWKVMATDSNDGNLSYSVNWGDNFYREAISSALPPQQNDQQATFTHSYAVSGVYNPVFTVTNQNGVSAKTSLSVNVGNSIVRTLRVGHKGEDVKFLQSILGINSDGSFGPKTRARVIEWQIANGLTADGIFGPASRMKANIVQ